MIKQVRAVATLKMWGAFALPICLLVLIVGPGGATPISLLALLAATVAAQLPLFGIATALLTFRTQAGIRLG